ncbi:hypothetical protein BD410DRAFT_281432 [Rickenella mellea]|uniref:C2H2-type domain-containing protein n=1 Tax=Rickenella mellea TaxID=50990 RepID=A0A4Y7Q2H1_9AGAM|nr:hypothetical protein BD410DRAFT_281432 [Rickenella mellea]
MSIYYFHGVCRARRFTSTSGGDFSKALRSAAVSRVLLAFTRTNSLITDSAWRLLYTQVEDDEAEKDKPRPREIVSRDLTCPHCTNGAALVFRETAELQEHIRRRHTATSETMLRCPHCPRVLLPVFRGTTELEDHILRRHPGAETTTSNV